MTNGTPHRNARPARCRRTRAFTLAELVVAMAIVTLLMAGIGSAVLISSHALPANTASQSSRLNAVTLLDQLESELAYAVNVTERTGKSIAFTVPDRDADGNPERIRYNFDGGALTREFNGSAPQTILTDVETLAFDCATLASPLRYDGLPVEDASATLLSENTGSSGQANFALSNTSWIGQRIVPSLPGDAVSWRITRADFLAERKRTTAADIRARIYESSAASLPIAPIFEEQPFSASLLSVIGLLPIISTFSTYRVDFSLDHHLRPADAACLVVAQLSGSAGTLDLSYSDGSGRLVGTPSTWAWSLSASRAMQFSCYGKITRRGATTGFDREYLSRVGVRLKMPADQAERANDILVLNRPEMLSRMLALDFSRDPRTVDEDGDGAADWTLLRGAPGDVQTSGKLSNTVVFGISPEIPIASNTTIDLTFRATQPNADADALRLVLEPTGGNGKVVIVSAVLESDRTQSLYVLSESRNALFSASGLSDAMINVTLILDAAIDGVNVSVNGARGETAPLANQPLTYGGPSIQIGQLDAALEIDNVRIRTQ